MRIPWFSTSRRVRYKPLLQVPFVGRDRLFESLESHLQAAAEGLPQYVVLEGPAGIGKSALLTEFTLIQCRSAKFFVGHINASDCSGEAVCISRLFSTLQTQSEAIVDRLFQDTKRVRKGLAVDWEEAEFRTFLASADWADLQAGTPAQAAGSLEKGDALTQLLNAVGEHPWGVGAATILDKLAHHIPSGAEQPVWQQRLISLLSALKMRGGTPGSALVLVVDQLEMPSEAHEMTAARWAAFWQVMVSEIEALQLPLLLIWAGTSDSVTLVSQALEGQSTAAVYPLGDLGDEEQNDFVQRIERGLPRAVRESWTQAVASAQVPLPYPGPLILAATALAAQSSGDGRGDALPNGLVRSDVDTWVGYLIEASRYQQDVDEVVFRQFLESWAFLPPGQEWGIEDMLLLCHPETVDLDPVAGRTILETLLAQWVKYGLLRYNAFDSSYATGDSVIQDSVQRWLYADADQRSDVAEQRRVVLSVLTHVKQGDAEMLAAVGEHLQGQAMRGRPLVVEDHIIPSFRHFVWTLGKDERHQAVTVLESLHAPVVLKMLPQFLSDEDGQVRSRAVQTLAQLAAAGIEGADTFPLLRDVLEDENSDVRWIAADALRRVRGAAAVDALIPLLGDEDKEVGRVAADVLGEQGDRRAVPHLIAAMRDDYPLLRESAAVALGQLADPRAQSALQELARDDSARVRRSAETALDRLDPP